LLEPDEITSDINMLWSENKYCKVLFLDHKKKY